MNVFKYCISIYILFLLIISAQAFQPGTNIWGALHYLQQKNNQEEPSKETKIIKDVCAISHSMQHDVHTLNQNNKELTRKVDTIIQDKHANRQFQDNMLQTLRTLSWYSENNISFLNKTKEEFDRNVIALQESFLKKLQTLDSTIQDKWQELTKIYNALDGMQHSLQNNNVDHKVAGSLKVLYDRLRIIEPLDESFLISQNSVGQGNIFVITQPGYYKLTQPIFFSTGTAILINASHVILDLNGMFIDGGNRDIADNCAITIKNTNNLTIKNGTIRGSEGIVISNARDITIKNIDAIENQRHAIALHNVQQARIKDCMISQVNGGNGLVTDAFCKNIIVKQCIATLCTDNGYALSGTDIVLLNSISQANDNNGVFCSELTRGHLQENTIEGNGADGILLDVSTLDVQAISNRILGNKNIGLNNESTNAMCLNNFSARNETNDYEGIKALPTSKATSFWHNVYG